MGSSSSLGYMRSRMLMLYIVDRGCDKLNFGGDQGRSTPPLQTGLALPLWSKVVQNGYRTFGHLSVFGHDYGIKLP